VDSQLKTRSSRGKYSITLEATKGARKESFKTAIAERDKILSEGFTIVEIDMEPTFKDIENASKGDVAAVIANTNPHFKFQLKTGNI
jgi:hypothetical protein